MESDTEGDSASGHGGNGKPSPLHESVLVLNKYYTALRVVNARRAFVLLYKNDAEAVEAEQHYFQTFNFESWLDLSEQRAQSPQDSELFVQTPSFRVMVPKVIRLMDYDKVPRREVKFNRANILARDGNCCQYCGRKFSSSKLSIDHVIPKSRGGTSTWTNVVTACHTCNTRKGGKLLNEAHLRLIKTPNVPKRSPMMLDKMKEERYQIWHQFLSRERSQTED